MATLGQRMDFAIDLAEPCPQEVQRLLLEQIQHARDGLLTHGASEAAVHEARKACKRGRAVVALVRSALHADDRRRLDQAFRDAARLIGPVRDADVMARTLASLGGPDDRPPEEEPPPAEGLDREQRGEQTVRALDHARALVSSQNLSSVTLETLRAGLLSSWRAARRAWDHADVDHHPEAFHEWRKTVKRLLYHVQLLTPLESTVLGALASQLDLLQESLGDHHDLHVLATSRRTTDPATREALRERAARLEERTLALGGWVLSAPSRQLQRWLSLIG